MIICRVYNLWRAEPLALTLTDPRGLSDRSEFDWWQEELFSYILGKQQVVVSAVQCQVAKYQRELENHFRTVKPHVVMCE